MLVTTLFYDLRCIFFFPLVIVIANPKPTIVHWIDFYLRYQSLTLHNPNLLRAQLLTHVGNDSGNCIVLLSFPSRISAQKTGAFWLFKWKIVLRKRSNDITMGISSNGRRWRNSILSYRSYERFDFTIFEEAVNSPVPIIRPVKVSFPLLRDRGTVNFTVSKMCQ